MGKYIKEHERYVIETMLRDGKKPKEIAQRLCRHFTTIYREIKRGTVNLRNGTTWKDVPVYCADVSQNKYDDIKVHKGRDYKADLKTVQHIKNLLEVERFSPYVVSVMLAEDENLTPVSIQTIYNYVHGGVILGLDESALPYKKHTSKTASQPHRPSYKLLGANYRGTSKVRY